MFRRGIIAARPLARPSPIRAQLKQVRFASASLGQNPSVTLSPAQGGVKMEDPEVDDPGMNGGYLDVPRTKRSLRDPYDSWWDPQERRNYGEPIHEDNDILGVFSTDPYNHFTTSWGWVLMGSFVATVGVLCGVVSVYYPDKGSVPRTFPDGLERELGGPRTMLAPKDGSDS
ncbi:hypothetical protein K461DRAFT_311681 [Myriangium duriaei CBS 260.36]|uniref:Uncharacterized protein n=1 Tax=Myriangium duriaei CBS 260.36 TaxID=1168546 RepID=A0A9P4MJK9_9PEZI|nr:hypothetical protein K461DRAFT_311681 [Myriangium duriaei CBS 260.36]